LTEQCFKIRQLHQPLPVRFLVNSHDNAGQKTHYFSAAEVGMPAATYIVKLTAGNVEFTGKVLEVR